jgi:hypothetical protein
MILYAKRHWNDIIVTNNKREAIYEKDTVNSKMSKTGRQMDAASLNDPFSNTNAPALAILYDENLIDIFRGPNYITKQTLVVN